MSVSIKSFKKAIIFSMIGIILCLAGLTVNAISYDSSLTFKRVKTLCVPQPSASGNESIYGSDNSYNLYSSVQSVTYTGKYFVFVLKNPGDTKNGLYVMQYDEASGKYVHANVGYNKNGYISLAGRNKAANGNALSYGHANDMTFIPKSASGASKDLIAITYTLNKEGNKASDVRARVTFLDANTFQEVNTIFLPYETSFGSIAYDKDDNKFYLGHGMSAEEGEDSPHTAILECNTHITNGKIDFVGDSDCYNTKTFELSSKLNKIPRLYNGGGQAEIHDGYYYKVDYDSTTVFDQGGFIQAVPLSQIKLKPASLDLNVSKRYGFSSDSSFKVDGFNFAEIEGLTFKGNIPYFLVNNGRKKECLATMFKPVYNNSINVSVKAKVSSNKNDLLSNEKLTAKFSNSSLSVNKNISYDSANSVFTLSGVNVTAAGKYTFDIKQNSLSNSNWKLDTSTISATANVRYSLNKNGYIYDTTYANGKDTFTNTYNYSAITVPISVNIVTKKELDDISNTTTAELTDEKGNHVSTDNAGGVKTKYLYSVKLDKTGTYVYYIKQINSGTSKSGMVVKNIDSSQIKVTVTITEKSNALSATISYSKTSFTNNFSMEYDSINVTSKIDINTTRPSADAPIPITQATLKKDGVIKNGSTSSNGKYSFNISVGAPGIYVYTIAQVSKSGDGIYKYDLDDKTITLTIIVDGGIDGLKATKTILSASSFNNNVTIEYNSIRINFQAKINTTSGSLAVPTTTAIITRNGVTHSVQNSGSYYNYSEKIDQVGSYTYTIKQNDLSNSSDTFYDIDNSTLTYVVNVVDNNGTLTYNVTAQKREFNNYVYTASKPTLKVLINTVNENSAPIKTTKAALYNSSNTKLGEVNSSGGYYTFSNLINISAVGTYKYTIKQISSDETFGIYKYSYDDSSIEVTIVVTKDNSGFHTNISYSKDKFSNKIVVSYKAISVDLETSIVNEFNGDSVSPKITAASYFDNNNTLLKTVNSSNNMYSYSVTINKPGEYAYKVKQDRRGLVVFDDCNVVMDSTSKVIRVKVIDDNGTLKPSIAYDNADSKFVNEYSVIKQQVSVPISVGITTTKQKSKMPTLKTRATLYDKSGKKIETVESDNNNYKFSNIDFIKEQTTQYKIRQEIVGMEKHGVYLYYYDSSEKNVVVKVYKQDNELKYDISYDDNDFNNTINIEYKPIYVSFTVNVNENNLKGNSPASVSYKKQSTGSGIKKMNNILKLDNSNESTVLTANLLNDDEIISTATMSDGKYTFENVPIYDVGEYNFTIAQVQPYRFIEDGVETVLDTKTIDVDLNVVDVDDVLTVSSVDYSDEEFVNTYTEKKESDTEFATVNISAEISSDSTDISSEKFRATLLENNVPVKTVYSENGIYKFEGLKLVKGTYNYKIKQVDDNDKFNIDTNILEVEVVVDENLKYTVKYKNDVHVFINNKKSESTPSTDNSTLVNVPDTSKMMNCLLYIFGGAFLFLGLAALIITTKKNKVYE